MMKIRTGGWAGILMMVFLVVGTAAIDSHSNNALSSSGDINTILLDSMTSSGKLERPAVQFPHQGHAASLGGARSCETCHELNPPAISFEYAAGADLPRRAVRDSWHRQCLDCHQSMIDQDRASGPLTCGGCHRRGLPPLAPPPPTTFYDTAHELHEYMEGGCALCHHAYDAEKDELYYAEGVEEACWQCHSGEEDGGSPSLEAATHQACLPCHVDMNDSETVPVYCGQCHHAGQ